MFSKKSSTVACGQNKKLSPPASTEVPVFHLIPVAHLSRRIFFLAIASWYRRFPSWLKQKNIPEDQKITYSAWLPSCHKQNRMFSLCFFGSYHRLGSNVRQLPGLLLRIQDLEHHEGAVDVPQRLIATVGLGTHTHLHAVSTNTTGCVSHPSSIHSPAQPAAPP